MKKYYLQIEKTAGGIWRADLFSKELTGDDIHKIELVGNVVTTEGYFMLLSLVSELNWYDNYLNK